MEGTPPTLFVSYAEDDSPWVQGYLISALTDAGVQCQTEETFRPGVPPLVELERIAHECQRVLLVLTPAYQAEKLKEFVGVFFQSYGEQTGTWPVIPLLLQPTDLPARLKMIEVDATNQASWPDIISRLCADLKRPVPAPAPKPPCPYPGMVPFSTADSARFFGRQREVQELLQELRLHPFLAVIGPSGSGKSSLVFAGLIPSLKRTDLLGPGEWLVRSMRPATAPLAALAAALAAPAGPPAEAAPAIADVLDTLAAKPGEKPTTLAPTVATLLSSQAGAQRLLLVVDQFEEVFHSCELAPFQEALRRVMQVPNCFVVLTVRADFYPELMTTSLWPDIRDHRVEVLPLDENGLRDAIVKPAEDVGVFVEAALVEQLVADAAGEPGILPFVQETLVLLWDKVERRYLPLRAYEALIMTARSYREMGAARVTGLQVAMADRADAALAALSPDQQRIARRIFLRLVQFGEGRADTRRQQPEEALRVTGDDPLFDDTLNALAKSRLLTLVGEEDSRNRLVDIAHEALIGGWPTLRDWLAERREAERTRRRLEEKAADWLRLGQGGGLLDEVEMKEADRWLQSPDAADVGTGKELDNFIGASRKAIDDAKRKEERARRRLQRLAIALAALAVLTLAAAAWAIVLKGQADNSAANARSAAADARSAAATAAAEVIVRTTAQAQADISARIAQAAATDLADEVVVRTTAQAGAETNARLAREGQATAVAARDEANRQYQLALSRQIAASARTRLDAGDAEQAMLLSVAAVEQVTETTEAVNMMRDALHAWRRQDILTGHTGRVAGAIYSANGQYLATTTETGELRLWQMVGEQRFLAIQAHKGDITDCVFSHDSKLVITAGRDGEAHVWQVETGALLRTVTHGHEIIALDISADDRLIATGGEDHRVWVWNVSDGRPVNAEPFQAGGAIRDVAFSPKGDAVFAASTDASVWHWDIATGLSAQLGGYSARVNGLLFDGTGRYLATRSEKTLLVWDVSAEPFKTVYLARSKHADNINGFAFSFDSQLLATAGQDGLARVWDLANPNDDPLTLTGHEEAVWGVVFSGDDRLLSTTGWDGTARLWRVADWQPEAVLPTGNTKLWNGTFSPDSTQLATPDSAGRVWLWYAQIGGENAVRATRFLPVALDMAGPLALVAGEDGQLLSWDPATGATNRLKAGRARLTTVAANADGSLWAVGNTRGQVRLISPSTGKEIDLLNTGDQAVDALLFLPDGAHIAVAGGSAPGTIEVWDLRTQEIVRELNGHRNDVKALALAGDALLSGGGDGTVRVWDWRTGKQVQEIDAGEPVLALAGSPDGQTVAAATTSGAVYVGNRADAGRTAVTLLRAAPVRSLAFSPDGQWLASGDEKGDIRLWSMATRKATVIHAHASLWVEGLRFSRDGEQLISLGADGWVRAWPVHTPDLVAMACRRASRGLTESEWAEFLPSVGVAELCLKTAAAPWAVTSRLDPPRPRPPAEEPPPNLGFPIVFYFEAMPGRCARPGETITLRWSVVGASDIHLEHGDESEGVTGTAEARVVVDEDVTYRLRVEKKDSGTRQMEIGLKVCP